MHDTIITPPLHPLAAYFYALHPMICKPKPATCQEQKKKRAVGVKDRPKLASDTYKENKTPIPTEDLKNEKEKEKGGTRVQPLALLALSPGLLA